MASIKDLKKDVNYVLGDLIEAVYIWEGINKKYDSKEAQSIIDEAISSFDKLIEQINDKKVENRGKHLRAVKGQLETVAQGLVAKINTLS